MYDTAFRYGNVSPRLHSNNRWRSGVAYALGSIEGKTAEGTPAEASGANIEMRLYRVFFRDRGLGMSRLRRVEELFADRHFELNDLKVLACQCAVAFSYLDIGMANYFRR